MCKEIVLKYDKNLDDKDIFAIQLFNEKFGENEIKLKHNDNRIVILLKEVDIERLRETSSHLSSYTQKTIFQDLIQSVEQIKSYGINGNKRNYVDYNKERKVKNRKKKEANRGQYYYAQGNTFKKENRDCPEEFINKILVGDSEAILKNIPDNSVDLIFTSPPYNFGFEYESFWH